MIDFLSIQYLDRTILNYVILREVVQQGSIFKLGEWKNAMFQLELGIKLISCC